MSDAHRSIRHLLQQLEQQRQMDQSRGLQIPEWLDRLIGEVAELFEPDGETARAGYVCSLTDHGWDVTVFLGCTEIIGGPADGASLPSGFSFDLEAVRTRFDQIHRITWQAFPAGCESNPSHVDECRAIVEGELGNQHVRLSISLRPPIEVGPGLRKDATGRLTRVT